MAGMMDSAMYAYRPIERISSTAPVSAVQPVERIKPVQPVDRDTPRVQLPPLDQSLAKNTLIYENRQSAPSAFLSDEATVRRNVAYSPANHRAEPFEDLERSERANSAFLPKEADAPLEAQSSGQTPAVKPYSECPSCASRVYVDGSDDPGVSFQSAASVPASTSGVRVAAHEGEHVTRESDKAAREGREVVQKRVSMQMAFCPDCHRLYYAGGTTTIQSQSTGTGFSVASLYERIGGVGESLDIAV